MNYQNACNEAAKSQGITEIYDALKAVGIRAEIWQTGGFCMVCAVPLPDDDYGRERYIGCTTEGAGLVTEDGAYGDNFSPICGGVAASEIARSVRLWLRENGHHKKPLTVGELKTILGDVDDAVHVTVASDGWWLNVGRVEAPPRGSDEKFSVVLHTVNNFDPRQF